jgi:hypothetical protein
MDNTAFMDFTIKRAQCMAAQLSFAMQLQRWVVEHTSA